MGNLIINERNPIGRTVFAVVTCFIALIGFVVMSIQERSKDAAQEGFTKNDFRVIVLYENNPTAQERLLAAVKGRYDEDRPTATLPESGFDRKFYALPPLRVGDLPSPMYAQHTNTMSVIYAVFKAPDASDKLRRWAKDNGYPDNFVLNWDNLNKWDTKTVRFQKPGSDVDFVAFFNAQKGLCLWDGQRILQVSAGGLTSNANSPGDEAYYRKYVAWLEALGQ